MRGNIGSNAVAVVVVVVVVVVEFVVEFVGDAARLAIADFEAISSKRDVTQDSGYVQHSHNKNDATMLTIERAHHYKERRQEVTISTHTQHETGEFEDKAKMFSKEIRRFIYFSVLIVDDESYRSSCNKKIYESSCFF